MDTRVRLLTNDKDEPCGLIIHDIEFSMSDIFECPPLHTVFHRLIKLQYDERQIKRESAGIERWPDETHE